MMENKKTISLDLQLFAEKDEKDDYDDIDYGTPTDVDEDDEVIDSDDDIEEEDVEVDEDVDDEEEVEDKEEISDDDDGEAVKDDKPKEGSTKTDEEKENLKKETDKPKTQHRDLNHEKAEERRRLEEQKKLEAEYHDKGFIAALDGKNPFTGEKVENADDIEEVKLMFEAKKRGLDPISDYHKMVKIHNREVKEATEKAEQEAKEKEVRNKEDIKTFTETHPDIDIYDLLNNNEDFKEFSADLIGLVPLTKIYQKWGKINADKKKVEEDTLDMKDARRQSSTGSLNASTNNANDGLYTRDELDKLTTAEIRANWNKVQKSYRNLK